MKREIYLDNSATTRPHRKVIEYMSHVSLNAYGNPSSLHAKGVKAEKLIKKARETIADSLKADPGEIYFTSGGTESNNLAILGYLKANPRAGRHLLVSSIEHPSVLEVYRYLSEQGYEVEYLDVDRQGMLEGAESIKSKIRADTALISVMLVNNETGAILRVEDAAKARDLAGSKAAIHVDAVQAYGKIGFRPSELGAQMVTFSSHKIHGPKGVGAIYVSRDIRVKPLLYGGGQELSLRSGTENVAGISGFGMAAEEAFERMDQNLSYAAGLKERFLALLKAGMEGYTVISPERSSPYILNVSFPGVKSEVLIHHLEAKGIYASSGSACSSRRKAYSHVLTAMGLEDGVIEGAVRFSFSVYNTPEDVEDTVETLKEVVPKIRVKRSKR